MQVAAQAARNGHSKFALELRVLVDGARTRQPSASSARTAAPVPITRPRGELTGLLAVAYPATRLAEMSLDPAVAARLTEVLIEERACERLRAHGYAPARKLLLAGPPGTGKTMTAAALAGEMGLALFTIQLNALITRYMGETAAKLRLVFDAIETTRGVYLFDEFDALGGDRASPNDVGEMRRVLNSFLQFIETDDSDSLIIAATNHAGLLDRAVFRRFDAVITYVLPAADVARALMQDRLAPFDTSRLPWDEAVAVSGGLSQADIAAACDHAGKRAVLGHRKAIIGSELVDSLRERHIHT